MTDDDEQIEVVEAAVHNNDKRYNPRCVAGELQTFRELAQKSDTGLTTIERHERVNGRNYTFYDTFLHGKLIEIQ